MHLARRVFFGLRDFVEIVVPCTAFCILFVAFIWQIISRYGFNQPISWSNEVQVFGYMWTVLPGAGYVMRKKRHVAFTVLYDFLGLRAQRIIRLAANSILSVTYCVLLPYAIRFVASDTTITPVFRLSRSWIFSSFIIFVITAIGYSIYDVYRDCLDIFRGNQPVDHRLAGNGAKEEEDSGK